MKLIASYPALAIFDHFTGQVTESILQLLGEQAAKNFLRQQFQDWYASKICKQLDGGGETVPIDLRLSVVKPLGAKWMVKLYDYLKSKPEIVQNGFKGAGITDCLTD